MFDLLKRTRVSVYLFTLLFVSWTRSSNADNECAPRGIEGQSVVCVCNATYCDDITRVAPEDGQFVTYTSSEAGSRFKKSRGNLANSYSQEDYSLVLDLNVTCLYQACEGFGGAVTDAAGINWKSLPETMQQFLIDSYFGWRGLEYNMIRLPIGGTDFSTYRYSYNEQPVNDAKLTNYTLAPEDYLYKIPMIKAAMEVAISPIHIVSTTWSPPMWMKTHFDFSECGLLAPEFFQTYADYHIKFLEMYRAEGIPIWGVTTTNEPSNGLGTLVHFNCLAWTPDAMGYWIQNHLGPTIRCSKFKDVKILCCDDQRPNIPFWFNLTCVASRLTVVESTYPDDAPFGGETRVGGDLHPKALNYIDGVAVHFYDDASTSPVYLTQTVESHPDKFILGTEACEGFDGTGVLLGSWERAKDYVLDILQDLNHYVVGWIDWNLCLDTGGGPNWVNNFVDSPIVVNATAQEFYKQPMFYAMGHFSKFIPRGSRRIAMYASHLNSNVSSVAFTTTRNTIVAVLYNDGNAETVTLRVGGKEATVPLEAHSVCTVELCAPVDKDKYRRTKPVKVNMHRPIVIQYEGGTVTII